MSKLLDALYLMPTKVPGINRLTMQFYCTLWDVLGLDLAMVWAESEGWGAPPVMQESHPDPAAQKGGPCN